MDGSISLTSLPASQAGLACLVQPPRPPSSELPRPLSAHAWVCCPTAGDTQVCSQTPSLAKASSQLLNTATAPAHLPSFPTLFSGVSHLFSMLVMIVVCLSQSNLVRLSSQCLYLLSHHASSKLVLSIHLCMDSGNFILVIGLRQQEHLPGLKRKF